jgi:hypothetical protein
MYVLKLPIKYKYNLMGKVLIYHWKRAFLTSRGYVIKIEMRLVRYLLTRVHPEYPEDYKFNWIAFNQDEPSEKVLFDNHHNKAPHFHFEEKEVFFKWLSLEQAEGLFFQKVTEKFGEFNYY